MSSGSKIEWTEQTWNPTTGCTKVSPGCKHCYAEVMAHRLHAMGAHGYDNAFRLSLHSGRLAQPVKRRKPTVYFVNSMSDLFHGDVPDAFLDEIFAVIEQTPQHTYQILTKRAERLPDYFADRPCPRNVWLGCRWCPAQQENERANAARTHMGCVSGCASYGMFDIMLWG